jgi:NAD-dependent protein deacetylase/lipoamidase
MNAACDIPDALVTLLRDAQHVCILTGAGVSAESGVATFRDAQDGLWAQYKPQDLATPEAFEADPALIWRWYRWRRELVAAVQPNPGHHAIAELGKLLPRVTLITQNVDGLHQRAGSKNVIEFHGNLFDDRCFADGTLQLADPDMAVPSCPDCGAMLRPGVVWFGEAIPEAASTDSHVAASDCDLFMSVGTSSLVYPAAGLAELAQHNGAHVVEINPTPTAHAAGYDFIIAGKSGRVLPELLELLAVRLEPE